MSLTLCYSIWATRDLGLLDDLGDAAGAHGTAALADREPQPLIHRDRLAQLDSDRHIVTRHPHLRPRRQLDRARHIRRPEKELRTIVVEERLMPPTLLLRQHIHLTLEIRVRRNAPRLAQHLTTLDIILPGPTQQRPDVVPRLTLIQQLAEHLHTRTHRLLRRPQPDDLHLITRMHLALLRSEERRVGKEC